MRKRYESIPELIDLLEKEKKKIEARIVALESKDKSFEEEVILKYIETRSTPKTAKYLRDTGHRTSEDKSYTPADISKLIMSSEKTAINPVLLEMAREIFCDNSRAVDRLYN